MRSILLYHILCLYYFCGVISCTKSEKKGQPILIVHGGAGEAPEERIQGKINGVKQAVRAGYEYLLYDGNALDAVEAAVASMERNEYFNAGYGSVLNIKGEVEMEAAIMRGEDLNVGAVTLVKDFWHPIRIARKVLTDSPHCILGGEGAKIFAIENEFEVIPQESLITPYSMKAFEEYLASISGNSTAMIGSISHEIGVDTVGAVAIDANGNMAAATSTGGLTGKAVGRIGDVTQIGAGTYADNFFGAVSATGHGESILKYGLAHRIIYLMEKGVDAETATNDAINDLSSRLNNNVGAITISKERDVGVAFTTNQMSWAYLDNNHTIYYGIYKNEILQEDY